MTYSDFTLTSAESQLGLTVLPADLFPDQPEEPAPAWLVEQLRRARHFALTSEKVRSEFLVAPILTAACEMAGEAMSGYSGERLDIDPDAGLMGVTDFILAITPPVPRLKAPLAVILEAKRGDIELGLGQCIAQMVGAQRFNARAGLDHDIYGCVTSGEMWQFLELHETTVRYHHSKFVLLHLEPLLGAFRTIVDSCLATV